MFGKTHTIIAMYIAQKLNLEKREGDLLAAGSVSPDSWMNFPHHKDKEFEIVFTILEARKHFLEDDDTCFHDLGIALHYIQDRWTLRPRISEKHTEWERLIDKAVKNNRLYTYPQLKEFVNTCTMPSKDIQKYLDFIKKCNLGVKTMNGELEHHFELLSEGHSIPKIFKGRWKLCKFELTCKPKLTIWQVYWAKGSGVEEKAGFPVSDRWWKNEWWEAELEKAGFKPLRGLGAKVINFALLERPSDWSTPVHDLNLATWISLEVAKNTFLKPPMINPMLADRVTDSPGTPTSPLQVDTGEAWFDLKRFPSSKDEE